MSPRAVAFLAVLAPVAMAQVPAAGLTATNNNYGAGCGVECSGSFYERLTAAAFDLANRSAFTMIPTGSGYLVVPGSGTYVVPSGGAIALSLGDDAEVVVTLSQPFVADCNQVTTQLTVCSNGFVSLAPGNGTGGTPAEAVMLTAPQTAWWSWHDYDPSPFLSGKVKYEEVGTTAYVTWDGVFDAGGAGANRFQFQFDLVTGVVHLVYDAMSLQGSDHLVGFTRGTAGLGVCMTDLSLFSSIQLCCAPAGITPLQLDMLDRPVVGTVPTFLTSNIPPRHAFLMVTYGLLPIASPGLNLSPLLPGCFLHHDWTLGQDLFAPAGTSQTTTAWLFNPVPNMLALYAYAQAAAWVGGLQTAVTSNAVEMMIGNR